MKLKSTLRSPKLILAIGLCSLLIGQSSIVAARNNTAINGGEDPVKKEKEKAKAFASHNNQSVKIYPDAWNRDMHIVAKDNNGKSVDFFVFDLEGTLIHNYRMNAKDHYRISGLKRGTYIYRVFCGDLETASGKFEIR